jgi:hypothetical protein
VYVKSEQPGLLVAKKKKKKKREKVKSKKKKKKKKKKLGAKILTSETGLGECLRRTGNMRAHTTTASIYGCRPSTQLSTNHRALTNQFEFPQLYGLMVVDCIHTYIHTCK